MRVVWFFLACVVGVCVGCDLPTPAGSNKPATAPVSPESGQPATTETQTAPPMERVVAEAGVGKKGQSLEGDDVNKVIAAPVRAKFRIEQELTFKLVEHALNLYKATNGKAPQSHDEFMEKIIKENNIKLPELPEGQRYIWVPEEEELYVERPARQ